MFDGQRSTTLISVTILLNLALAAVVGFLVGHVVSDHLGLGSWVVYAVLGAGVLAGIAGTIAIQRSTELRAISTAGLTLALTIASGLAIGHNLDDQYGTTPTWMFTGILLGTVIGLVGIREREDFSKLRHRMKILGAASTGLFFFAAVIAGLLIGRVFDDHMATAPWLTAFGSVIGILAGFRAVYRMLLED